MKPATLQTWIARGILLLITFSSARAESPESMPVDRKQLHDPAPAVRLRAALALAETYDAEAIPVLIDLLADLSTEQRAPAEEILTRLAGEWAPVLHLELDDEVSRGIRRDAWASWWRRTDAAALTALFRKHIPTAEDRARVRVLIARLGDADFAAREEASRELFVRGRTTLPQLKEASKHSDLEVSRRVRELIERIEREPAHHLPIAAIRLLAVRKLGGAVETLLAFLPYAEDEARMEEVSKSLAVLAQREGEPDAALVRALADPQPELRAVAAEALARGGGAGRREARKLLQDDSPTVRLRTAMALVMMKEREGVPVLIDLLTVLPSEQVGQVEDALCQLAGDTAPEVSLGEKADEKKKCRDAWFAWWKVNAARVDLDRLTSRPLQGFTVICDANRVYELDRHGKQRWSMDVRSPIDAVVLPNNRVLVAEWNDNRVTERDLTGKILWQQRVSASPYNVQRLSNGNTFIATTQQVLEVDRAGKLVYAITPAGGTQGAYRSRQGHIVCLTPQGQCLVLDTSGKQIRRFPCQASGGGIDLPPNGRILVASRNHKVVEFDTEGRTLLELSAPFATTATALPGGHVLVSSQSQSRVFELDRAGKLVWEHRGVACYRARRR